MSKLDDFLNLNNVSEIKKTISVKINGKDLELVIRPLTEDEHNEFQRRSNVINKNKITFDSGKYSSLVLDACIVEPNFKDAGFLKKVGCVSATEFINKKFPAGVVSDISVKIQELSGFESYEMEIENAKN
jgi:hypothetical protein